MTNLKQMASSPLCKDGKKAKEDECLISLEMATDNVLKCAWCEGRIHAGCSGISEDQCRVLDTILYFFCPSCLQLLPNTDTLSLVDTKVAAVEESVLEIKKQRINLVLYQPNTIVYINLLLNYPIRFHPSQIKIKYVLQQFVETIASKFTNYFMEVNSETDNSVASNLYYPTTNAAQAIVDELADRERRKNNIIVYNFPECTDCQADIEPFH